MYWYKRYLAFLTGIVLLITAGCKPDTSSPGRANYFDLKGYFQEEAARMAKRDPAIVKTSIHNGNSETQHLHIGDWLSEFSLFIASDINKAAWKSSYKADTSGSFISYTARDPDLRTHDILIKKEGIKIKWILIHNYTKRSVFGKNLSETIEKLSYFPDSLYQVQRKQYTRMLGTNIYNIKGLIN